MIVVVLQTHGLTQIPPGVIPNERVGAGGLEYRGVLYKVLRCFLSL